MGYGVNRMEVAFCESKDINLKLVAQKSIPSTKKAPNLVSEPHLTTSPNVPTTIEIGR